MLERIKEFFINLFKLNNQQYIEAPKEVIEPVSNINEEVKTNFKDEIAINNEEGNRALKLQQDFKSGLIQEEDLSEEDFIL